jgi:branched-chain amino acid transport system permease protein
MSARAAYWIAVAAVAAILVALPLRLEVFDLVDLTVFAILAMLALSLAFVWGYAGILSLGQSVFFGLGGYAYAVAVLNLGESTIPALLGIVVPALLALLLGYFMFWGRIGDVYLAVITLTVSLIFFHLINSTSGGEFRIGKSPLGGYNGIPGLPPLNVPGNPAAQLGFDDMYYVAVGAALGTYLLFRWLLSTRFGRVVVALRENELRTELLGYDTRRYKLGAYAIGAAVAGGAGVLYATWQALISPTVFGVFFTAQIIVWVMVGGLGTLIGPVLAAIGVQWLVTRLGQPIVLPFAGSTRIDPNIVLGLLFIVFVLLVPAGTIPTLQRLWRGVRRRRAPVAQPAPAPR